MKYKDVKEGDVIDHVRITEVEDDGWHKTFTFDLLDKNGWSFLVVYPCDYESEAIFSFNKDEEKSDQYSFIDELYLTEEL